MQAKKLKVVILTHGGAERFIELLSDVPEVEIVGVFLETVTSKPRSGVEKLRRSIRYDGYAATVTKFISKMLPGGSRDESGLTAAGPAALYAMAERLNVPLTEVENYHSEEAMARIATADADLGVLYGTNIVRESVFSIPKLGSINIHQGLAPLYRGGPTVFWELFNGEREIGITAHFVAAQVDTGDIVLQRTLPLEYDHDRYGLDVESFLDDFRAGLVEPSAQLLVEAIRMIAAGTEVRRRQDISVGRRYRLPTKTEKDQLLAILKKRQKAASVPAAVP